MVKREEVEALLKRAEFVQMGVIRVWAADVAELARTWLAVDAAPVVGLSEGIYGASTLEVDGLTAAQEYVLNGRRVRLVPEADSGGDRG